MDSGQDQDDDAWHQNAGESRPSFWQSKYKRLSNALSRKKPIKEDSRQARKKDVDHQLHSERITAAGPDSVVRQYRPKTEANYPSGGIRVSTNTLRVSMSKRPGSRNGYSNGGASAAGSGGGASNGTSCGGNMDGGQEKLPRARSDGSHPGGILPSPSFSPLAGAKSRSANAHGAHHRLAATVPPAQKPTGQVRGMGDSAPGEEPWNVIKSHMPMPTYAVAQQQGGQVTPDRNRAPSLVLPLSTQAQQFSHQLSAYGHGQPASHQQLSPKQEHNSRLGGRIKTMLGKLKTGRATTTQSPPASPQPKIQDGASMTGHCLVAHPSPVSNAPSCHEQASPGGAAGCSYAPRMDSTTRPKTPSGPLSRGARKFQPRVQTTPPRNGAVTKLRASADGLRFSAFHATPSPVRQRFTDDHTEDPTMGVGSTAGSVSWVDGLSSLVPADPNVDSAHLGMLEGHEENLVSSTGLENLMQSPGSTCSVAVPAVRSSKSASYQAPAPGRALFRIMSETVTSAGGSKVGLAKAGSLRSSREGRYTSSASLMKQGSMAGPGPGHRRTSSGIGGDPGTLSPWRAAAQQARQKSSTGGVSPIRPSSRSVACRSSGGSGQGSAVAAPSTLQLAGKQLAPGARGRSTAGGSTASAAGKSSAGGASNSEWGSELDHGPDGTTMELTDPKAADHLVHGIRPEVEYRAPSPGLHPYYFENGPPPRPSVGPMTAKLRCASFGGGSGGGAQPHGVGGGSGGGAQPFGFGGGSGGGAKPYGVGGGLPGKLKCASFGGGSGGGYPPRSSTEPLPGDGHHLPSDRSHQSGAPERASTETSSTGKKFPGFGVGSDEPSSSASFCGLPPQPPSYSAKSHKDCPESRGTSGAGDRVGSGGGAKLPDSQLRSILGQMKPVRSSAEFHGLPNGPHGPQYSATSTGGASSTTGGATSTAGGATHTQLHAGSFAQGTDAYASMVNMDSVNPSCLSSNFAAGPPGSFLVQLAAKLAIENAQKAALANAKGPGGPQQTSSGPCTGTSRPRESSQGGVVESLKSLLLEPGHVHVTECHREGGRGREGMEGTSHSFPRLNAKSTEQGFQPGGTSNGQSNSKAPSRHAAPSPWGGGSSNYPSMVNMDSVTPSAIADYGRECENMQASAAPVDKNMSLRMGNAAGDYPSMVNMDSVTANAIADYGRQFENMQSPAAPVDKNMSLRMGNAAGEYPSMVNMDSVTANAIADYGRECETMQAFTAPVDKNMSLRMGNAAGEYPSMVNMDSVRDSAVGPFLQRLLQAQPGQTGSLAGNAVGEYPSMVNMDSVTASAVGGFVQERSRMQESGPGPSPLEEDDHQSMRASYASDDYTSLNTESMDSMHLDKIGDFLKDIIARQEEQHEHANPPAASPTNAAVPNYQSMRSGGADAYPSLVNMESVNATAVEEFLKDSKQQQANVPPMDGSPKGTVPNENLSIRTGANAGAYPSLVCMGSVNISAAGSFLQQLTDQRQQAGQQPVSPTSAAAPIAAAPRQLAPSQAPNLSMQSAYPTDYASIPNMASVRESAVEGDFLKKLQVLYQQEQQQNAFNAPTLAPQAAATQPAAQAYLSLRSGAGGSDYNSLVNMDSVRDSAVGPFLQRLLQAQPGQGPHKGPGGHDPPDKHPDRRADASNKGSDHPAQAPSNGVPQHSPQPPPSQAHSEGQGNVQGSDGVRFSASGPITSPADQDLSVRPTPEHSPSLHEMRASQFEAQVQPVVERMSALHAVEPSTSFTSSACSAAAADGGLSATTATHVSAAHTATYSLRTACTYPAASAYVEHSVEAAIHATASFVTAGKGSATNSSATNATPTNAIASAVPSANTALFYAHQLGSSSNEFLPLMASPTYLSPTSNPATSPLVFPSCQSGRPEPMANNQEAIDKSVQEQAPPPHLDPDHLSAVVGKSLDMYNNSKGPATTATSVCALDAALEDALAGASSIVDDLPDGLPSDDPAATAYARETSAPDIESSASNVQHAESPPPTSAALPSTSTPLIHCTSPPAASPSQSYGKDTAEESSSSSCGLNSMTRSFSVFSTGMTLPYIMGMVLPSPGDSPSCNSARPVYHHILSRSMQHSLSTAQPSPCREVGSVDSATTRSRAHPRAAKGIPARLGLDRHSPESLEIEAVSCPSYLLTSPHQPVPTSPSLDPASPCSSPRQGSFTCKNSLTFSRSGALPKLNYSTDGPHESNRTGRGSPSYHGSLTPSRDFPSRLGTCSGVGEAMTASTPTRNSTGPISASPRHSLSSHRMPSLVTAVPTAKNLARVQVSQAPGASVQQRHQGVCPISSIASLKLSASTQHHSPRYSAAHSEHEDPGDNSSDESTGASSPAKLRSSTSNRPPGSDHTIVVQASSPKRLSVSVPSSPSRLAAQTLTSRLHTAAPASPARASGAAPASPSTRVTSANKPRPQWSIASPSSLSVCRQAGSSSTPPTSAVGVTGHPWAASAAALGTRTSDSSLPPSARSSRSTAPISARHQASAGSVSASFFKSDLSALKSVQSSQAAMRYSSAQHNSAAIPEDSTADAHPAPSELEPSADRSSSSDAASTCNSYEGVQLNMWCAAQQAQHGGVKLIGASSQTKSLKDSFSSTHSLNHAPSQAPSATPERTESSPSPWCAPQPAQHGRLQLNSASPKTKILNPAFSPTHSLNYASSQAKSAIPEQPESSPPPSPSPSHHILAVQRGTPSSLMAVGKSEGNIRALALQAVPSPEPRLKFRSSVHSSPGSPTAGSLRPSKAALSVTSSVSRLGIQHASQQGSTAGPDNPAVQRLPGGSVSRLGIQRAAQQGSTAGPDDSVDTPDVHKLPVSPSLSTQSTHSLLCYGSPVHSAGSELYSSVSHAEGAARSDADAEDRGVGADGGVGGGYLPKGREGEEHLAVGDDDQAEGGCEWNPPGLDESGATAVVEVGNTSPAEVNSHDTLAPPPAGPSASVHSPRQVGTASPGEVNNHSTLATPPVGPPASIAHSRGLAPVPEKRRASPGGNLGRQVTACSNSLSESQGREAPGPRGSNEASSALSFGIMPPTLPADRMPSASSHGRASSILSHGLATDSRPGGRAGSVGMASSILSQGRVSSVRSAGRGGLTHRSHVSVSSARSRGCASSACSKDQATSARSRGQAASAQSCGQGTSAHSQGRRSTAHSHGQASSAPSRGLRSTAHSHGQASSAVSSCGYSQISSEFSDGQTNNAFKEASLAQLQAIEGEAEWSDVESYESSSKAGWRSSCDEPSEAQSSYIAHAQITSTTRESIQSGQGGASAAPYAQSPARESRQQPRQGTFPAPAPPDASTQAASPQPAARRTPHIPTLNFSTLLKPRALTPRGGPLNSGRDDTNRTESISTRQGDTNRAGGPASISTKAQTTANTAAPAQSALPAKSTKHARQRSRSCNNVLAAAADEMAVRASCGQADPTTPGHTQKARISRMLNKLRGGTGRDSTACSQAEDTQGIGPLQRGRQQRPKPRPLAIGSSSANPTAKPSQASPSPANQQRQPPKLRPLVRQTSDISTPPSASSTPHETPKSTWSATSKNGAARPKAPWAKQTPKSTPSPPPPPGSSQGLGARATSHAVVNTSTSGVIHPPAANSAAGGPTRDTARQQQLGGASGAPTLGVLRPTLSSKRKTHSPIANKPAAVVAAARQQRGAPATARTPTPTSATAHNPTTAHTPTRSTATAHNSATAHNPVRSTATPHNPMRSTVTAHNPATAHNPMPATATAPPAGKTVAPRTGSPDHGAGSLPIPHLPGHIPSAETPSPSSQAAKSLPQSSGGSSGSHTSSSPSHLWGATAGLQLPRAARLTDDSGSLHGRGEGSDAIAGCRSPTPLQQPAASIDSRSPTQPIAESRSPTPQPNTTPAARPNPTQPVVESSSPPQLWGAASGQQSPEATKLTEDSIVFCSINCDADGNAGAEQEGSLSVYTSAASSVILHEDADDTACGFMAWC
eukprot:gene23922-9493_t